MAEESKKKGAALALSEERRLVELERRKLALAEQELERDRERYNEKVKAMVDIALAEVVRHPPEVKGWRDVETIDRLSRKARGMEEGAAKKVAIDLNFLASAPPPREVEGRVIEG
jgi:hypothetical protein